MPIFWYTTKTKLDREDEKMIWEDLTALVNAVLARGFVDTSLGTDLRGDLTRTEKL